jgi:hypothetical protein
VTYTCCTSAEPEESAARLVDAFSVAAGACVSGDQVGTEARAADNGPLLILGIEALRCS